MKHFLKPYGGIMLRFFIIFFPTLLLLASAQAENQCTPFSKIGIGVVLQKLPTGAVLIDQVLPKTPAERYGLRAGDQLLGIMSIPGSLYMPTDSLSLEEVVHLIRGEEGTMVYMDLLRETVPLNFQIVREKIEIQC